MPWASRSIQPRASYGRFFANVQPYVQDRVLSGPVFDNGAVFRPMFRPNRRKVFPSGL